MGVFRVTDLGNDSRLLQQVLLDHGALYGAFLVKVDVNVLAETTGVVVPDSLGITKSCKQLEWTYYITP